MTGRQLRNLAFAAASAGTAIWLIWTYIFNGLTCGGHGCG